MDHEGTHPQVPVPKMPPSIPQPENPTVQMRHRHEEPQVFDLDRRGHEENNPSLRPWSETA